MSYLNITLQLPNINLTQLNSQIDITNDDTLAQVINLLSGATARVYSASVQITTLTNNPSVVTDGTTGSTQKTINKL